jgi:DNA-binding transcriptional regulator YbjK
MRLTPEQRRAVIVTSAVRVAKDVGLVNVTHSAVAKRCVTETSVHTVQHYFPIRASLWQAVVDADCSFAEQGRGLGL